MVRRKEPHRKSRLKKRDKIKSSVRHNTRERLWAFIYDIAKPTGISYIYQEAYYMQRQIVNNKKTLIEILAISRLECANDLSNQLHTTNQQAHVITLRHQEQILLKVETMKQSLHGTVKGYLRLSKLVVCGRIVSRPTRTSEDTQNSLIINSKLWSGPSSSPNL